MLYIHRKNAGTVLFFMLVVMERKFVVTLATTETKGQKKLKFLLSLDICVSLLTCAP